MLSFKKLLALPMLIALTAIVTCAQSAAAPNASPSATLKATGGGKPALVLPPEKAQPVKMPKFEKPPIIDGKLDDEAWKSATVLKDFYQVQPGDNIAPSRPTEVMIGYD